MEVIGTGFGRTGTLSTKKALERLGFGPCHHMEEALRHPSQFEHLAAHVRGEPVDWTRVFGGYRAQVDFPGATIWRELLTAFPEAKVLHTVRDPDRWYDSTRETIYPARTMVAPWVRRLLPFIDVAFEVNDALIWNGLFEGSFANRERAIEIFEARTADVVRTVPPERLLVLDVTEGWEPLCAFLDVPVPDEVFPHVNDRVAIRRQFAAVRAVTYGAPWLGASAVAAALGSAVRRRAERR